MALYFLGKKMKISFIGSGRVATQLANCFFKLGHSICQIYSPHHAERLAKQVNAQAVQYLDGLECDVDLIIVAVKDEAIADLMNKATQWTIQPLIVHTSGSTEMYTDYKHSGVFYPLQTFSFESQINWKDVPLLIEAQQEKDLTLLKQLAEQISERVYCYNSQQRLSLHLAAVFACNFSNYCYDVAEQLLTQAGVNFELLHPLMLETAKKATQFKPHDVQTGPAKRGDEKILQMHQQLLQTLNQHELAHLYQLLSTQIKATSSS